MIIYPPHYLPFEGHLVFLAGPIQGAPDWQQEAIAYLQKVYQSINIASPRKTYIEGTFDYAQQVDWESHYLREAARCGVIMFWLTKEAIHIPERAYAQTSRFELGEWVAKSQYENIKLVIGIEEGFSNARYIRHRLAHDCPSIPICTTLEDTCTQTLTLLLGKS